jgi:hypothetical protein
VQGQLWLLVRHDCSSSHPCCERETRTQSLQHKLLLVLVVQSKLSRDATTGK